VRWLRPCALRAAQPVVMQNGRSTVPVLIKVQRSRRCVYRLLHAARLRAVPGLLRSLPACVYARVLRALAAA